MRDQEQCFRATAPMKEINRASRVEVVSVDPTEKWTQSDTLPNGTYFTGYQGQNTPKRLYHITGSGAIYDVSLPNSQPLSFTKFRDVQFVDIKIEIIPQK